MTIPADSQGQTNMSSTLQGQTSLRPSFIWTIKLFLCPIQSPNHYHLWSVCRHGRDPRARLFIRLEHHLSARVCANLCENTRVSACESCS